MDGEKEVSELDAMANAQGITKGTLTRAKTELKKDGKIRYRTVGKGKGAGTTYFIYSPITNEQDEGKAL